MVLKYATLPKRLVRANQIYSNDQLKLNGLKPTDKLLEDGSQDKKTEQRWVNNTKKLLTTSTFKELIAIEDKTVAIVHGLCDPPLLTIDIDCKHKSDVIMPIVNALPEHQKPLVISKSVGKEGYHLLYHYTDSMLTDYVLAIHKGGIGDELDVLFSSTRVLFIGNKGNLTKEHIYLAETDDPDYKEDTIRPVPQILQLAVMALFKDTRPAHLSVAQESGTLLPEHTAQKSNLGYMFKEFILMTPEQQEVVIASFIAKRAKADLKSNFRQAPQEEGYPYHPKYYNATPNDLLLRLSGSLKNDSGVDIATHKYVIETINSLLPHSKNSVDLKNEILDPDTKSPYNYNERWEDMTSSVQTVHGQIIDIYRITRSTSPNPHMLHNVETGEVRLFKTVSDMIEELAGEVTLTAKKLRLIQSKARLVDLLERPDKDFGLISPEKDSVSRRDSFNVYRRTTVQEMFYSPEETAQQLGHRYKPPLTILRAIESQMGYDKTHELFLPFIRRKLMTHEPSPLIFALMGPPHSFKTGLVEGLLKPLFSSQRYLKTSGDILTEKYNDFLVNLDILLVDEIHHLVGTALLKPVVQTLNKFGAEYHEGIRHMYASVTKGKDVHQEVTPFITMNKVVVPATETVGERRLVVGYAETPLRIALGMEDPDIKAAIKRELLDFAYYLAKEVSNISPKDYGHNERWKEVDNHYYQFMEDGISVLKRLSMAVGMTTDRLNYNQLRKFLKNNTLSDCVVKLGKASHGTPYRIRVWNAKGGFTPEIPGVLDEIENIDPSDVVKALSHNEKVLKPCIVGNGINQMKQDIIVTKDELLAEGLLDENGLPWRDHKKLEKLPQEANK